MRFPRRAPLLVQRETRLQTRPVDLFISPRTQLIGGLGDARQSQAGLCGRVQGGGVPRRQDNGDRRVQHSDCVRLRVVRGQNKNECHVDIELCRLHSDPGHSSNRIVEIFLDAIALCCLHVHRLCCLYHCEQTQGAQVSPEKKETQHGRRQRMNTHIYIYIRALECNESMPHALIDNNYNHEKKTPITQWPVISGGTLCGCGLQLTSFAIIIISICETVRSNPESKDLFMFILFNF